MLGWKPAGWLAAAAAAMLAVGLWYSPGSLPEGASLEAGLIDETAGGVLRYLDTTEPSANRGGMRVLAVCSRDSATTPKGASLWSASMKS